MDPIRNPYAPGAGTPPPELAGRDDVLEAAHVALERSRLRRPIKNMVLIGLRGVGKTVLLDTMRELVEKKGMYPLDMEAAENRSLPSVLAPRLHVALLQLSRRDATKQFAQQALKGLAGFVKALKVTYQDIEVGLDLEPERGLADSGNLEGDLQALFEVAGEAATKGSTSLVLLIDELQYVPKDQLAALIAALHRTAQRRLPVIMVGAGLPQLRGQMGNAKSYAERLFDFPLIGSLSTEDARIAIAKPAADEGVSIDPDALDEIMVRTQGYPYFLQEWGKHVWDVAETSPITTSDVVAAIHQAKAALDANFFLVRFDRLTPSERRYLRAMAHLGAGSHRSGAIAQVLNRQVQSLAPVRSQLIGKGMLWSPGHGDTDFTVPMFDEFMQRIMPGDQWRSTA
ncbi:MAG: ATP-binding protein [Caldilineaceae bacterium]|nr:ATP-binding protein [Caldilineaceae bacterium]